MAYFLQLSLDLMPERWNGLKIGPNSVVRGWPQNVREHIEEVVNRWMKSFTQRGAGPKDIIKVYVYHGQLKELVLLDDSLPMEQVFEAVWSAIEKHHLDTTIKKPRAKKQPAKPIEKKSSGRL